MSESVKVPLFRPFRHPRFRRLCLANFMANIGSWMQLFATGWLVASQSKDPATAAMAQTLTQIPIFLFSLLGGVLADKMNAFRYLGAVNIQMALMAGLLAAITLLTTPSVGVIFVFTFLIATGTALKASAWQASMSSLVEHQEIEAAATLNGLSYNLASVIGPLAGSLLFWLSGPGVLYLTNALCLSALIVIYWQMRHVPDHKQKGQLRFMALLRQGMAVSFGNGTFRSLLLTTALLFFPVSVFQALLAVYVSNVLHGQSEILGWLMGGFGGGAVISAFAMPGLRAWLPRHRLLALAACIYGSGLLCFSLHPGVPVLLPVAFIAGFAWAAIVSTMNSAAQSLFEPAIRARALSIYSMIFYGALTTGSLTWGNLSSRYGITTAFSIAGGGIMLTGLYILLFKKVASVGSAPVKVLQDS